LSFAKAVHAGALDCADMHEYVFAAIIRLNESEALLAVEPFHCSLCHKMYPSLRVQNSRALARFDELEILEEVLSLARFAARLSRRPKLESHKYGSQAEFARRKCAEKQIPGPRSIKIQHSRPRFGPRRSGLASWLFLRFWRGRRGGGISREARCPKAVDPRYRGIMLRAVFLYGFSLIGFALFVRHPFSSSVRFTAF
jgi:hypothetical protein